MDSGIKIGRIFGIDIFLHWSLLIIVALITASLGMIAFPNWHPDWPAWLAWSTGAIAAVLLVASILFHEMSHALVGRRWGMHVPRITLFLFGGMAHLESDAPEWRAEFWMAIAGPLASLVLGFALLTAGNIAAGPVEAQALDDPQAYLASLSPLATVLLWLGTINIILALFNMVPGFPLDGGRVLRAIVWGVTGDIRKATHAASMLGQLFGWYLIANGVLMVLGVSVPLFGTGLVGGLWLIFIGWFINRLAVTGYQQLLTQRALTGIPVSRLMQTGTQSAGPTLTLDRLVDEILLPRGQRAVPIEDDGRLRGLVSLEDIRRIDRNEWANTPASTVMTPRDQLRTLAPEADLEEALRLLGSSGFNQAPVVDQDRLLGMLRREDLLHWLALHDSPR